MGKRSVIGERIYNLMNIKGLSQTDIANKIGVDQPLVSQWINKGVMPRGNNLIKLCQVLGASTSFVLYGKEDKKYDGAEDKKNDHLNTLLEVSDIANRLLRQVSEKELTIDLLKKELEEKEREIQRLKRLKS